MSSEKSHLRAKCAYIGEKRGRGCNRPGDDIVTISLSVEEVLVRPARRHISVALPALLCMIIVYVVLIDNSFSIEPRAEQIYIAALTIFGVISTSFIIASFWNSSGRGQEISSPVGDEKISDVTVHDDMFLRSAFPDLFFTNIQGETKARYNDIVLRLNIMLDDKYYGDNFSALLLTVAENKRAIPQEDREQLDKKAGETTRKLYQLILERKQEELSYGGNGGDIDAIVLGFEELNKDGLT